ncbi:alpha-tectorin-like isoform X2 [Engraulis encrasicolus]
MPHSLNSQLIQLTQPLQYFNQNYDKISAFTDGYLNLQNSGDYIVPFYIGFESIEYRERGNIFYQQYTSADVLHNATQDINSYFPNVAFNATWVFVATWDRVVYDNFNVSIENDQEATFQVVLISDRDLLFIFMNYGDITLPPQYVSIRPLIALIYGGGVITIDSCFPNGTIDYVNLKTSSNINVPGRWVLPASIETNFTCSYPSSLVVPTPDPPTITPFSQAGSYPSSLVVPTPDPPTITPFSQAEQTVGMSLTVLSAERLNETVVEEQVLTQLREFLRERGIDVSWIRVRRMTEKQP